MSLFNLFRKPTFTLPPYMDPKITLKSGMSLDEVVALWGKPTDVKNEQIITIYRSWNEERWFYYDPRNYGGGCKIVASIYFEDGKLVYMSRKINTERQDCLPII